MRGVVPLILALSGMLASCVTVNVYFPAAAAEQAADRIIDTVTSSSSESGASQGDSAKRPAQGPTSHLAPRHSAVPASDGTRDASPILLVAAGRVLDLLVPAAYAQGNANIDISTPEIRAVTASMQKRFPQLEKYFASGAIGLTNDGLIEIRDQNAVPLAERAQVKRLVSEDNADRTTLYAEIAKANGHPEWEPDIRRTFARRWIERGAKPGWYYKDASGNWVQK
ncbi:MAG: YdbL family protein [Pseudomonadota bacterium]|jgi:Uncharacterized protein conserved in bacteria|nr:MAG: DUF1318 domain-containing protein [Pseudomonadota bacterium]